MRRSEEVATEGARSFGEHALESLRARKSSGSQINTPPRALAQEEEEEEKRSLINDLKRHARLAVA